jgi:tol-pal system protein YbgF
MVAMTALSVPFRFSLLGVLGLALLAALPASRAEAQDIQTQLDRLQRELTTLQSYVYKGGSAPASGAVQQLPAGSAASIEVRLSEMESSLRQLRGQLEEMNYQIRQNSQRLEKFMADAEYRLTILEGGDPGQAPAASSGASSGASATLAPSASDSASATVSSGGVATGAQVGTLGQVSENDVSAIQQRSTVAGESAAPQAVPPATQQAALPQGSAEEQYNYALGLLRQTRFDEAQVALDAFLAEHPEHSLAANAKYWLGETYYVRADYQQAAVAFAEGFQQHPEGGKAPDNLLKLGMSLGQLGDKQNACATFAQLQQRFPTAPSNIQQKAQLERQRLGC